MNSKRSLFYDDAWAQWNDMILYSPAPRLRRTKIISWLGDGGISSLLDVGCGNGEFLFQVHKSFPEILLAGADISSSIIDNNRNRLPGMDFFVLNLEGEVLPKRFDAVVCMEVIEHCTDYPAAIRRLADMTGKILFLTVPCGPLFEIDKRVGHVRHFNVSEIRAALVDSGLRVTRVERWGFPFFNLYKHFINISPDKMCDSFLSARHYSLKKKWLAKAIYLSFKASLPVCGYQLFAVAERPY